MKIDVDKIANTTGSGENVHFPKIVFEEEKRNQGTSHYSSKSKKHGVPPDSAGTKYFVNSNDHPDRGSIRVTFSKDDAKKSSSGSPAGSKPTIWSCCRT